MNSKAIAVIGTGCRLPGANNPKSFWDLLIAGRDAVTEIPDGRWSKPFFFHPRRGQPGKTYTWAAGVLDQVDRFDAAFFGISPREARQMDPQQRLLLEVAWEALEDAGLKAAALAGSGAGVYVGVSGMDYANLRLGDPASADAYFMTGITASIVANRLSYVFDLRGPSFSVDTACSSSLVALHLACESLRNGETPLAMVGGVNLLLAPYSFVGFSQASMLSPTGRCHAFDARADGYVRAEGAGVVILKPLDNALADGDPIRAVIMGTGVNSDGHTMGLSLPSEASQSALLKSIYAQAGIDPSRLAFVEAHGTGTLAGDPIELAALGKSLALRRDARLPIGSVKTNLGHLETASGMAGLIKTVMALQNRLLPPSLHFETPNPDIAFDALNLEVVTKPARLPQSGTLLAGVNSFGFGGTNAHAIVATPPPAKPQAEADTALPPLLLSARSPEALAELAQGWSQTLATAPQQAAPLLRAAARRRDHHRYRLQCRAPDADTLAATLAGAASGQRSDRAVSGLAVPSAKIAFAYSGNGAQYLGMARDALQHSRIFRAALSQVDTALRPFLHWSVAARLQEDDPDCIKRTDIAQPLLFAVQVAITQSLRAAGIEPDFCFGHSVGEIAAAWSVGALSLASACRIVVTRSHQQHRTRGAGRMAALGLDAARAAEIVAREGGIEIAAINSRGQVTVAGSPAILDRLAAMAERDGWRYTALDIDYAFHSSLLDPIRDDLLAELSGIEGAECHGRFISTVAGGPLPGQEMTADYWWHNVRDPVHFSDAVDTLVKEGVRIFVEIGPNAVLQTYLRDGLRDADADGRVLFTLSRRATLDHDPFPEIAGQCYAAGYDLAKSAAFDGSFDIAGLPRYPWQKEQYWFPATTEAVSLTTPLADHRLLGFRKNPDRDEWTRMLDLGLEPWLADHALEGVAVLPAAALLEMALAVARIRQPNVASLALEELEIRQALTLDAEQPRSLQVRLDAARGITIESRPRFSHDPWTLHAFARIAADTGTQAPSPETSLPIRSRMDAETLYRGAEALGLEYGPQFRTVAAIDIFSDDCAEARLAPPAGDDATTGYLLSPALLDGGFQTFLALLGKGLAADSGLSLLPWRFTGVRLFAPCGRLPVSARVNLTRRGTRTACGSVVFRDAAGNAVAAIAECWFRQVRLARRQDVSERAFHFALEAMPRPGQEAALTVTADDILAAMQGDAPLASSDAAENALLLEAYIAAAAHRVLLKELPESFTITELVGRGAVAAEAAPLLAYLLEMLAGHGAAREEAGRWQIASSTDLPEPSRIWQTVLAENPAMTAELALAAAASESLSGYLRTGSPAVLPTALLEQFHYASPKGRLVAETLRRALCTLAAGWPAGRPLRVLEINAGSGILSRLMLDALAGWPGTLCYVASDADAAQLGRLSARLQGSQGATAVTWDPRDGLNAAVGAARFDLLLAPYAMTRQQLDRMALRSLRRVLRPDGLLIACEPEPNLLWNWIFGQQASWWQQGVIADFPIPPLRPAPEWCGLLQQSGFAATAAAALAPSSWPAGMIIAQGDEGSETQNPAASHAANVIIVAEHDDAFAEALAAALKGADNLIETIAPPELGDGKDFRAMIGGFGEGVPDVILLPQAMAKYGHRVAATNARLARTLAIARLVTEMRDQGRLWIATMDAQQASAVQRLPEDAALWGLGRTIANEMPQLECRLVDISSSLTADQAARLLAAEITQPDKEREIVLTPHGRHVMRLRRGLANQWVQGPVRLSNATPGRLEGLHWDGLAPRQPSAGEVAIEVRAADINFRDVMWALDLLPEEALLGGYGGPAMGLACSGIVTAVGDQVSDFEPGDRVLAIAPAALASDVVAASHTVTRLPDGLDFAAAASMPVAFVTVIYGLGHLARLKAGERVLIHGAAGGVGIAAVQYARHCGAEIIATAGSPAKRAFLHELGVAHVFDSRDLSFVEGVRQLTGGEGVDVVLNSLSGEAMEQSLGLVRPFGRFVELGKRDFYENTRIGLKPLRRSVSYFAVDVDRLPVDRPDLSRQLMRETIALLEQGAIHALPHRTFARAQVGDAFRLMQASGHIGKIVLSMDAEETALPATAQPFAVRGDSTYLITGGLSGFGLATAQWLAGKGARALALVGRRGLATPGAAEALEKIRATGVDARAFACDAADGEALAATLTLVRRDMPPLRGVVHAAMQIDDGLLKDLDATRLERVLAPKLGGALRLDRLTRTDPVELFLLYSSATTALGAPGQGSYVAANMALEGVARRRRAAGLPALVVGWGPISDAGYLARHQDTGEALARRLGADPMPAKEALDALPALWASGQTAITFAAVRWDAAERLLPVLTSPTFEGVAGGRTDNAGGNLREKLAELPPEERKALILTVVLEETARILSTSGSGLDPHRPVAELGMDSLMAVELRLALEARLGIDLPMLSLSQQTSLMMIATRLARSAPVAGGMPADIALTVQRHENIDAEPEAPFATNSQPTQPVHAP